MNNQDAKVFIIDDDKEIREGISLLLKSAGYKTESFPNTEQFLVKENPNGVGCILLDVFLEGKTGLELQVEIETKFECMPIIFITGQGNISMSVEAIKKGALNFLQKPIDDKELFKAIDEALNKSKELVKKNIEIEKFKSLVNSLTAREYEIFRYVITGMLNKQIGSELWITEHTVKNHRLKITNKLQVKSAAELIHIANVLNIKEA